MRRLRSPRRDDVGLGEVVAFEKQQLVPRFGERIGKAIGEI
jgi:hypothetical protein